MEEINQSSIRKFFDEFIDVQNHKIGSIESANFARNISGNFYQDLDKSHFVFTQSLH